MVIVTNIISLGNWYVHYQNVFDIGVQAYFFSLP